ncbi:MAG: stage 0 sporulation family protein [Clostridiales Family XIII bacterium]|jgi:cell fate regulator YaaT (PSP1 superfamily)|nr:stage 0 sporulation family protein [Clostridiales Family XIII bacterium]
MRTVATVKFRTSQKHYYFDPAGIEIGCGDRVVVETSRGVELGIVRGGLITVSEKEFGKSIRPILRKAAPEDIMQDKNNLEKRKEAVRMCKQKIAEYKLQMKLIDAEYTFDSAKLIFYFTAEKRVDFRELVKDLAGYFRTRIELRQIGVRDEARILGGFGTCGRELCCKGWLMDFEPVSIKMAKVQNLSLNPGKISGCCGRLMCCLKYENDVYVEMKKGLPDVWEVVETKAGRARVCDVNIFDGIVRVKYIEEERTHDQLEKLGNDIFEFDKSEVKRCGKNGKGRPGEKGSASGL